MRNNNGKETQLYVQSNKMCFCFSREKEDSFVLKCQVVPECEGV